MLAGSNGKSSQVNRNFKYNFKDQREKEVNIDGEERKKWDCDVSRQRRQETLFVKVNTQILHCKLFITITECKFEENHGKSRRRGKSRIRM